MTDWPQIFAMACFGLAMLMLPCIYWLDLKRRGMPREKENAIMSDSSGQSGGVGFAGLLTLLFIGLKLAGFIDWPWLWVLSPIWISLAIALVFLLIWLAAALQIKADRKRRG